MTSSEWDGMVYRPREDAPANDGYRAPPHNIEAEQALLGSVLIRNSAIDTVAQFLTADHFYEPLHGRIYEACRKVISAGRTASGVSLKSYFDNDEAMVAVGGSAYLARLAGAATTMLSVEEYGRTIFDLALRRELIYVAADLQARAMDAEIDDTPARMIAEADTKLVGLLSNAGGEGRFFHVGKSADMAIDLAAEAYRTGGALSAIGLSTGLPSVDAKIGALEPGMQIVIAGPTSSGKTAFSQQIALHNALDGKSILIFSHEMTHVQLTRRFLAHLSGIPASRIKHGRFSEKEFDALHTAATRLKETRFWVEDTRNMTAAAISARARQVKREHGLDLMMVDYLQILAPVNSRDRRDVQFGEMSKTLRDTSGTLEVPNLLLSQLNRESLKRDNHRPRLSDLRESGAIEQDADGVLFVHREETFLTESTPPESDGKAYGIWQMKMAKWAGKAEIIVGKMREGERGGSATLGFDGPLTMFYELDNPPVSAAQATQERENQEALAL